MLPESIGKLLKHPCQIEHTRHGRASNGFTKMLATLVAFIWQPRRSSLHIHDLERDFSRTFTLWAYIELKSGWI